MASLSTTRCPCKRTWCKLTTDKSDLQAYYMCRSKLPLWQKVFCLQNFQGADKLVRPKWDASNDHCHSMLLLERNLSQTCIRWKCLYTVCLPVKLRYIDLSKASWSQLSAADLNLLHCYQLLVAVQPFFAPGRPERIPSSRRTRSGHDRGGQPRQYRGSAVLFRFGE